MPNVSIERLTLQVPGMSEPAAQRLALAVADGLASAGLPGGLGDVSTLRVDLNAKAGATPDRLAAQIVSEILRRLQLQP